jgi:lysyl-tRNA synthetase class 2
VQWFAVQSSVIASVGYDFKTLTLGIEFHSGRVYSYQPVPDYVYHSLLMAPSLGKFFNRRIKGRYEEAKVDTW